MEKLWCEFCFPALISQIIPASAPRARVKFLLSEGRVMWHPRCSVLGFGTAALIKLRISVQYSGWISFELVFGITPKFVFS